MKLSDLTISLLILIWNNRAIASITRLEVPQWIHHGEPAQMACHYDKDLVQLSWSVSEFEEGSPDPSGHLLTYVFPGFLPTSTWTGPALDRMTGDINGRSSTLTIHAVDWQIDEGKYWCETIDSGDFGLDVESGNALVSVSPNNTKLFHESGVLLTNGSSVSVIHGVKHNFICRAEGSKPPATLTWILGDTSWTPPQINFTNAVEGLWDTSSTFTLSPDASHQQKELQCIASVPAEPSSQALFVVLNVQGPLVDVSVVKSVEGPLAEGDDLMLTCSSDGNLALLSFMWFKDDIPISNDNENLLTLTNSQRGQAGYYHCGVETDGLPPIYYSEEVAVIVYYSPQVTNKEDDKKAAEDGADASIDCVIIGNPEPTLTWYYSDGTKIISGSRIEIQEDILGSGEVNGTTKRSRLLIKSVSPASDFGLYQCTGRNSVGSDTHSVILTGVEIPNLPEDVVVLKELSTTETLTVQWKPGFNGGVTQWFIVQYREEDRVEKYISANITEVVGQDTYNHTIQELLAGTAYVVVVSSGNMYGQTNGVEIRELGITKPYSPEELDITIRYNSKAGTLQIHGLITDGDASTCLQLQQTTDVGTTWEKLECLDENVEAKEIPDNEAVEFVRGMYCVRDVCGGPSAAETVPVTVGCSCAVAIAVGASICAACVTALVVIIVVMCKREALIRNKSRGKDNEAELDKNVYQDLNPATLEGNRSYEQTISPHFDDKSDSKGVGTYEVPDTTAFSPMEDVKTRSSQQDTDRDTEKKAESTYLELHPIDTGGPTEYEVLDQQNSGC